MKVKKFTYFHEYFFFGMGQDLAGFMEYFCNGNTCTHDQNRESFENIGKMEHLGGQDII